MDDSSESVTRRRVVSAAALLGTGGALAGCLDDEGDGATDEGDAEGDGTREQIAWDPEGIELPDGVTPSRFERGPVPDAYTEAVSQGREQRAPDRLLTKDEVLYMPYDRARRLGDPDGRCSNCDKYVPDEDGDGFGACSEVEGYTRPQDWCQKWREITITLPDEERE